ncbi:MAG: hypothetical protein M3120_05355 [Pseudomonadota bacterium]|nr:hypothetical protein [Pseudomonadota bacterium]
MLVNAAKLNIGFLIYTYDKIDDAKINMEIIRSMWQSPQLFREITIVHAYNGDKSWYKTKYLEDELVITHNSGHFQGASEMIDAGIKLFGAKYTKVDYVIVLASDTWLVKPSYIAQILGKKQDSSLFLAACAWNLNEYTSIFDVGIATDFFIIDLHWSIKRHLFPLRYKEFKDKYGDLLLYINGDLVQLEKLLLLRFVAAIYGEEQDDIAMKHIALSRMYRMKDREPVHTGIDERDVWIRKRHWPNMGFIGYDEPEAKRAALKNIKEAKGASIERLLNSSDLDYYNSFTPHRVGHRFRFWAGSQEPRA